MFESRLAARKPTFQPLQQPWSAATEELGAPSIELLHPADRLKELVSGLRM